MQQKLHIMSNICYYTSCQDPDVALVLLLSRHFIYLPR